MKHKDGLDCGRYVLMHSGVEHIHQTIPYHWDHVGLVMADELVLDCEGEQVLHIVAMLSINTNPIINVCVCVSIVMKCPSASGHIVNQIL